VGFIEEKFEKLYFGLDFGLIGKNKNPVF